MKRILMAGLLALVPGLAQAQLQTDAQALVDRATLALQDTLTLRASNQPRISLTHARAVAICPQILKAGFFFAGAGGHCVLAARAANGTWSYPAFYVMGSLSFGLQIGLQDSEVVFMIMTDRGLNAILNNNLKLGAGASVAIAVFGGGVQGDTTTAVGADILAFMISRGAFAGISLEGSVLSQLSEWDQQYYGAPLDARQIVMQMQGRNPGAEPLREMLTRYGAAVAPAVASYAPGYAGQAPGNGVAPDYAQRPVNLQPQAPIQQQALPPPR